MKGAPKDGFSVRVMSRGEIDLAVDWAAEEGWNPGLHDADCFHAADPKGFFVGMLGGEPVAVLSAVRYGEAFGFLGLYIVKPGHRGKGYGLRVWKHGLDHVRGRALGLDGVVDRQDDYRKSGFVFAHRNVRFQGAASAQAPKDPGIVSLDSLPFEAVRAYDAPFFPADRSAFLQCGLRQPDSATAGILREGKLAGYGVIRACRVGHKIGPLFADDPESADRLFASLASRVPPGAPIVLDVPEPNAAAVALAERNGMKVVFETARMYAGKAPDLPPSRWYGVTTFELG
jgi:ribosomal protein S18 acetylase RimI-like enzyme